MLRILSVRCFYQSITNVGGTLFEQGFIHPKTVGLGKLRGEGDNCAGIAFPKRMALLQLGNQP